MGHIQINTAMIPMKPATVIATKQRSTKSIVSVGGCSPDEFAQSWRRSWRMAPRSARGGSSPSFSRRSWACLSCNVRLCFETVLEHWRSSAVYAGGSPIGLSATDAYGQTLGR